MIYELSNGLKPVKTEDKNELKIGTVLYTNGYGRKYVVIKNLAIDEKFRSYGAHYRVIDLDNYKERGFHAYELKWLSEKEDDRIQTYITNDLVSGDKCLELWELSKKALKMEELKKEKGKQDKLNEIERLKKEYPYLIQNDGVKSGYVIAAKNIRIELKKHFPKVKFSVTSKSYSMGNSVSVGWTDGPKTKEVEKIIDKYQYGSFDGMTDCYNYSHNVWDKVFGGSKYVMASRSLSDDFLNEIAREMGYFRATYNKNTGSFDGVDYETSQVIMRQAWVS